MAVPDFEHYECEWSKDWTKEEFKQIWQSGDYRKYTQSRKDTNAMVAYYIDKYGEDVPENIWMIRGICDEENRKRIGNSWHPLNQLESEPSKVFIRNSKHSTAFFYYETTYLKNKRGIHFDEVGSMYEEEWLLNPSDFRTNTTYLHKFASADLLLILS